MSIRPLPVLRGIQHRSAADHDLSYLFAAVTSAREADRLARGGQRREDIFRSDSGRLAASLNAYATALEKYRLPVPHEIRDELRLRRQLSS
ncbi:hypothetical protein [Kribbella swartbergensis]